MLASKPALRQSSYFIPSFRHMIEEVFDLLKTNKVPFKI